MIQSLRLDTLAGFAPSQDKTQDPSTDPGFSGLLALLAGGQAPLAPVPVSSSSPSATETGATFSASSNTQAPSLGFPQASSQIAAQTGTRADLPPGIGTQSQNSQVANAAPAPELPSSLFEGRQASSALQESGIPQDLVPAGDSLKASLPVAPKSIDPANVSLKPSPAPMSSPIPEWQEDGKTLSALQESGTPQNFVPTKNSLEASLPVSPKSIAPADITLKPSPAPTFSPIQESPVAGQAPQTASTPQDGQNPPDADPLDSTANVKNIPGAPSAEFSSLQGTETSTPPSLSDGRQDTPTETSASKPLPESKVPEAPSPSSAGSSRMPNRPRSAAGAPIRETNAPATTTPIQDLPDEESQEEPVIAESEGISHRDEAPAISEVIHKTGEPEASEQATSEMISQKMPATAATLADDTNPRSSLSELRSPKHGTPQIEGEAVQAAFHPTKSHATAPTPSAPETPHSSPVFSQVEGTVRWMLGAQEKSAELQLHPDNLGQITISLKVEGNQVHARVWASEATTVAVLNEHRDSLQQSLQQQGMNLGSFDLHSGNRGEDARSNDQSMAAMSFQKAGNEVESMQDVPTASAINLSNPHQIEIYA